MYEDMNALYSDAITQYMSTEILGKVNPEKVSDIQSIAPDADIGYTLEVDLEVPVYLHNYFTDYLLTPEKQIVPENWLSPYNVKLIQDKEMEGAIYETRAKGHKDPQRTQDETKEDPISESVCLKPKMYSVLLAGHDLKTPETDADFEKELEEEEYRKSQDEKKWKKKHGI
ncbi:16803_t:CDS:2 [Funneliformis mosseae]|uniref:16803_t:CDS:1 n=1 Tax=Funneliformis mosseae TaxID=27381 RepID=A0A9N9H280_FUNMO|nr:16803_t:CDS:2 [Funneliformis mosseae]